MTLEEKNEKLNHPCFPQPIDRSVRVWRYLDISKLIWTIENNALWFSRLDLLGDPHEGSITPAMAEARTKILDEHAHAIRDLAKTKREFRQISENTKTSTYANCWHMGNYESEAMWRLYCPDGKGIAIQSTYSALFDSLESKKDVYIGLIKYIDYEKAWFPDGNLFYPVMHKRLGFSHESEVRLVTALIKHLTLGVEVGPVGVTIPWDYKLVIDAIYVNPYAPDYYVDVLKSLLSKYDSALMSKICWSKMRSTPSY